MRIIALALPVIFIGTSFAGQIDNEKLSEPPVNLVRIVYDSCISQFYEDEPDSQPKVLKCVNDDLTTSLYSGFNSYQEIISYISKENGDQQWKP